jgi:hypothetical protein
VWLANRVNRRGYVAGRIYVNNATYDSISGAWKIDADCAVSGNSLVMYFRVSRNEEMFRQPFKRDHIVSFKGFVSGGMLVADAYSILGNRLVVA